MFVAQKCYKYSTKIYRYDKKYSNICLIASLSDFWKEKEKSAYSWQEYGLYLATTFCMVHLVHVVFTSIKKYPKKTKSYEGSLLSTLKSFLGLRILLFFCFCFIKYFHSQNSGYPIRLGTTKFSHLCPSNSPILPSYLQSPQQAL